MKRAVDFAINVGLCFVYCVAIFFFTFLLSMFFCELLICFVIVIIILEGGGEGMEEQDRGRG